MACIHLPLVIIALRRKYGTSCLCIKKEENKKISEYTPPSTPSTIRETKNLTAGGKESNSTV